MGNAALLKGHHKTRTVFKRFSWKCPLNRICTSRSCHISQTVMKVERWAILRLQRAWTYMSQCKPSLGLFKKEKKKKSLKTVGKYESVLQKRHPQSNTFVNGIKEEKQRWTFRFCKNATHHLKRDMIIIQPPALLASLLPLQLPLFRSIFIYSCKCPYFPHLPVFVFFFFSLVLNWNSA